ncbi:MAG: VOC family protein [Clostridiales bacterium]|nr:VOC family protein [Clostridiales bacterium]
MAYDHAAFQVSDLERSIRFYTEKLGFKLLNRTKAENYGEIGAFLDFNGARLELLQSINKGFVPKKPEKPFCPHLCFEVQNMEMAIKNLKEKEVQILDGPNEITGKERWIYFADPDMNVLEYMVWLEKQGG